LFVVGLSGILITGAPVRKLFLFKGKHEILIDDGDYDFIMDAPEISKHGRHYSWTISGVGRRKKVRCGPVGGPMIYLHILLAQPEEGQVVIFRNDNRFDFRRENLMVVDRSYVGQRRPAPIGKSGYRGVTKMFDGWQAKITKDDKGFFIGYYLDVTHAAKAYNIAAKDLFGDDAYQNDVPDDIIPIRYKIRMIMVPDTEPAPTP
jgi:hypothetical protein